MPAASMLRLMSHPYRAAERALAVLAAVSAVATYLLVVLGGAVRTTGSGMGCPDWPLCKGKVGPLGDSTALWEQSHRYAVVLVTVLVALTAVQAWRSRVQRPDLARLLLLAVVALFVQAFLGAVTVWESNTPWTVEAHLGVGLLLVGLLLVAAVWAGTSASVLVARDGLAWVAVALTFVVVVSGAFVANSGSHTACTTWPLCDVRGPSLLQLAHRGAVALLVVLLLVLVLGRWSDPVRPSDRPLAVALLLVLAGQVTAGALTAMHNDAWTLRDLHLALGAALWSVVVWMAALPRQPRLSVLLPERVEAARR